MKIGLKKYEYVLYSVWYLTINGAQFGGVIFSESEALTAKRVIDFSVDYDSEAG